MPINRPSINLSLNWVQKGKYKILVQFRHLQLELINSVVSFYLDILDNDTTSLIVVIEADDEFLARQKKNDPIVKVLCGNVDRMLQWTI